MTTRPAKFDDVRRIAEIHKSQFGTHLLGKYSVELLTSFYSEFVDRAAFLVHVSKNEIDGFVLGGDSSQLNLCKNEFVRDHFVRCVWETSCRPQVWYAGVRGGAQRMWDYHKNKRAQKNSITSLKIRLLSIAVDKRAMGKGVAVELIMGFERLVCGITSKYGLSVKKDNTRAVKFYQKLGFEVESTEGESINFKKIILV